MLKLHGLTKHYRGQTAVADLTLQVEEGELLALVGGSGSGKTTTLKMINRLIEPSSGTVRIGDRDVAEFAPHELRRRIGYAFQEVGLFPHMTVAENIGITPTLLGWTDHDVAQRVEELLQLVELDPSDVMSRRPNQLSGGQQQRVGVARALAARPRVMLLDEPFGALDPLTRQRLQESFLRIHRDLQLTVVFVTHDIIEALALGDRIAVMQEGRLAQIDTPAALLHSPAGDYVRDLFDSPRREAQLLESLTMGTVVS